MSGLGAAASPPGALRDSFSRFTEVHRHRAGSTKTPSEGSPPASRSSSSSLGPLSSALATSGQVGASDGGADDADAAPPDDGPSSVSSSSSGASSGTFLSFAPRDSNAASSFFLRRLRCVDVSSSPPASASPSSCYKHTHTHTARQRSAHACACVSVCVSECAAGASARLGLGLVLTAARNEVRKRHVATLARPRLRAQTLLAHQRRLGACDGRGREAARGRRCARRISARRGEGARKRESKRGCALFAEACVARAPA